MVSFIRIVVAGTETLVNLANVVSIQFWEEGEYRRPYAAIVTTGMVTPPNEGGPATPHTITVEDSGPIAALRAELLREGVLPPDVEPFPERDVAPGDEVRHADRDVPEPTRNGAIIDESMHASGPKFDRSRPRRGYGQPQ